jgi:hypothetical protein
MNGQIPTEGQTTGPQLLVTTAMLARATDLADATVRRKVCSGAIVPDFLLHAGPHREPAALFAMHRLGELKAALLDR